MAHRGLTVDYGVANGQVVDLSNRASSRISDAGLMGRLRDILADDVRFYEGLRAKHGL